jgi:hypothetical protein
MPSQETNPYFPPQHCPEKPQSALPSTRWQLVWRSAKLGGKLGFYIVGGLTFLLWIGLLVLAAYKTARNGASILDELAKETEGRTLEYLGLSLLQVIVVTIVCGFFSAIVGGVGSLFRRNLRSDDSEIAK